MSLVPTLKRLLNTSYSKNCPAMSAPKKTQRGSSPLNSESGSFSSVSLPTCRIVGGSCMQPSASETGVCESVSSVSAGVETAAAMTPATRPPVSERSAYASGPSCDRGKAAATQAIDTGPTQGEGLCSQRTEVC